MNYTIKRTESEIDEVLNKAMEGFDYGTAYPGMSYEDGIRCFAEWLFGDTNDNPFE